MFANFCRGWHHCRCRPCPPPPPCNYLKKKNLRKWLSVGNLLRVERPFCTVLEIEATMQHQCPWSMFFTTHQKPTYTFIIEPLFLSKLQSAQFCWKTRSTKWWWFFVLQRQVCIPSTHRLQGGRKIRSTVLLKTMCGKNKKGKNSDPKHVFRVGIYKVIIFESSILSKQRMNLWHFA